MHFYPQEAFAFERDGVYQRAEIVKHILTTVIPNLTTKDINQAITKLLDYCKRRNWAGYDPYDALNSRMFAALPFLSNKLCRLVLTQGMKRSPVNLRSFFLVPKEQNPKALGLFVCALIRLQHINFPDTAQNIAALIKRIIELRSPNQPHYCWGYHFDWQSRHSLTPKFSPNIICTVFAANAFLDAFDTYADTAYLNIAVSAGEFLLTGLNISKEASGWCFSYTPLDQGRVHNANLLGAALLARLYRATGDKKFLDFATPAVRYSVSKQNTDGSWFYGEHDTQKWIDNFHTGYNLVALDNFCKYSGIREYRKNIEQGYAFFNSHFFTPESIPKYFHDRIYPIDIHSVAQSVITLTAMNDIDKDAMKLTGSVLQWAFKNLLSPEGYFYYQQGRFLKNRISYMRWSQAWMLYALAIYAQALQHNEKPEAIL